MSEAKPGYMGEELVLVNGELMPMEEGDKAKAGDADADEDLPKPRHAPDTSKADAQEGSASSAPPFRYEFFKG